MKNADSNGLLALLYNSQRNVVDREWVWIQVDCAISAYKSDKNYSYSTKSSRGIMSTLKCVYNVIRCCFITCILQISIDILCNIYKLINNTRMHVMEVLIWCKRFTRRQNISAFFWRLTCKYFALLSNFGMSHTQSSDSILCDTQTPSLYWFNAFWWSDELSCFPIGTRDIAKYNPNIYIVQLF